MKKIVHVTQSNGGVEEYLKMFFKYSNDKEYQMFLIASEEYRNSAPLFKAMGVKVYLVNMKREIGKDDFKVALEIYKILKIVKPDLVYSHSSKAGAVTRPIATILRIKNIYNPHGWAFDMDVSNKKKFLYKNIEKVLAGFTQKIIAISEYEKEIAIKNKIAKENKIVVIENAIDFNKYSQIKCNKSKKELVGWEDNTRVIGMVARITAQKSPETFVKMAELLIKDYDDVRFLLVGDGDKREEIEAYIKKKNISDKFYITGWTNNVEEYLSILDIAVLTSKWEGFGLVIPEYMAAQKPIVASAVGGIKNIIEDEKDGFLVENLNEMKFYNKVKKILESSKIKTNLIESAYSKAQKKYCFKRVVSTHVKLFIDIE